MPRYVTERQQLAESITQTIRHNRWPHLVGLGHFRQQFLVPGHTGDYWLAEAFGNGLEYLLDLVVDCTEELGDRDEILLLGHHHTSQAIEADADLLNIIQDARASERQVSSQQITRHAAALLTGTVLPPTRGAAPGPTDRQGDR